MPLLFAYGINMFSHDMAHFVFQKHAFYVHASLQCLQPNCLNFLFGAYIEATQ